LLFIVLVVLVVLLLVIAVAAVVVNTTLQLHLILPLTNINARETRIPAIHVGG
jgi:hypothetical protein